MNILLGRLNTGDFRKVTSKEWEELSWQLELAAEAREAEASEMYEAETSETWKADSGEEGAGRKL